jgi:beta-glucanase (GH16 family)
VKFQDDFTTLNRSVWCDRQWYEGQSPANSQYVQDGILHVVTRRSQGYPNASISSEPCGQATPKSFRHGYIEARFRWTKGNGSSPAFWLFSTAHATNPNWPSPACPGPECLSGEIDVFEGQGHQPDVYLGTIHRNSCGCYGVANQHRQGVGGPVGVDLTAGFHTYAVLWTASEVKWYLDGAFLGSVPAFDSIDQPMHLIFYQWPQSWTRDTDSTSPDELHTEVDWVKVWQK